MSKLRDKFIENGFPFDDIDPEMIDLLDVLNFHLGLKTKFWHYKRDGRNELKVIFDESVTDEKIYDLAKQTGQAFLQLNFYKWVRHYPVMTNWILNPGVTFNDAKYKKIHLDNVVAYLRGCKALK